LERNKLGSEISILVRLLRHLLQDTASLQASSSLNNVMMMFRAAVNTIDLVFTSAMQGTVMNWQRAKTSHAKIVASLSWVLYRMLLSTNSAELSAQAGNLLPISALVEGSLLLSRIVIREVEFYGSSASLSNSSSVDDQVATWKFCVRATGILWNMCSIQPVAEAMLQFKTAHRLMGCTMRSAPVHMHPPPVGKQFVVIPGLTQSKVYVQRR
jgi:hypothetical protein